MTEIDLREQQQDGGQAAHASKSSMREGDVAALCTCVREGDAAVLHLRERSRELGAGGMCGHGSVYRWPC